MPLLGTLCRARLRSWGNGRGNGILVRGRGSVECRAGRTADRGVSSNAAAVNGIGLGVSLGSGPFVVERPDHGAGTGASCRSVPSRVRWCQISAGTVDRTSITHSSILDVEKGSDLGVSPRSEP